MGVCGFGKRWVDSSHEWSARVRVTYMDLPTAKVLRLRPPRLHHPSKLFKLATPPSPNNKQLSCFRFDGVVGYHVSLTH
jgi:hypothetical protein